VSAYAPFIHLCLMGCQLSEQLVEPASISSSLVSNLTVNLSGPSDAKTSTRYSSDVRIYFTCFNKTVRPPMGSRDGWSFSHGVTLRPPNSSDVNSVDYKVWSVIQEKVYKRRIKNVDELQSHIVTTWDELDQRVYTPLRACVKAKGDILNTNWASIETTMNGDKLERCNIIKYLGWYFLANPCKLDNETINWKILWNLWWFEQYCEGKMKWLLYS